MTRKHALVVYNAYTCTCTSENEAAVGETVEMRSEVRVPLELNTVQLLLSHDSHMTYTHVDHVSVIAPH